MTPNQKFSFFMPAWNRCVKANGWHTRGGAAVVDGAVTCDEMQLVISIARKLSLATRHTPQFTLRDLRHACTILCLGRDKDTDKLNNDEQDYIVSLFQLLANPLSLKARQDYEACKAGKNPGKQKRRQHFIKSRAPEAVLRHLTHDLTSGETKDWESLDADGQAELARLLAQRPVYGHKSQLGTRKPERGTGAASQPSTINSQPKTYLLDPNKKFEKSEDPDWSIT